MNFSLPWANSAGLPESKSSVALELSPFRALEFESRQRAANKSPRLSSPFAMHWPLPPAQSRSRYPVEIQMFGPEVRIEGRESYKSYLSRAKQRVKDGLHAIVYVYLILLVMWIATLNLFMKVAHESDLGRVRWPN